MTKGFRGTWLRGTKDPLQAALGPLERAVMDTMWRGGELTVREVQAELSSPVAYTTVMTVLDRLAKKTPGSMFTGEAETHQKLEDVLKGATK